MSEILYQQGVLRLKQIIEENRPEKLVFLGNSANRLKYELSEIGCVATSIVFPSRRITYLYLADVKSVVLPSQTAIVAEDYAFSCSKMDMLLYGLPKNIQAIAVVGPTDHSGNFIIRNSEMAEQLHNERYTPREKRI